MNLLKGADAGEIVIDPNSVKQDSGHNEYTGSLSDRVNDIEEAFRTQKPIPYCTVEAVFDDYVLVHQYMTPDEDDDPYGYDYWYGGDRADICWKIPYSYGGAAGDEVTFGEPTEVRISTVVTEIADSPAVEQTATQGLPEPAVKAIQLGLKLYAQHNKGGDALFIADAKSVLKSKDISLIKDFIQNSASPEPSKEEMPASYINFLLRGGRPGYAFAQTKIEPITTDVKTETQTNQNEPVDDKKNLNQDVKMDLYQTTRVFLRQTGFDDATRVMHVDGVATQGNCENSKGQVYPTEVWQEALPHLQELLGQSSLLGEIEHPQKGSGPSLDRTCLKFTNVWIEEDQVKFQADILPTDPHGKNLQILAQNGIPINMSSRGYGRVKRGMWQGKELDIVQPGFTCEAFDAVVAGASPNSAINNWSFDQSKQNPKEEEEMTKEEMDAMLAQNKTDILDAVKNMLQTKEPEPVKTPAVIPPVTAATEDLSQSTKIMDSVNATSERLEKILMQTRMNDVRTEAKGKYNPQFAGAYAKHLDNLFQGDNAVKSVESLNSKIAELDTMFQSLTDAAPRVVGHAHVHIKKTDRDLIQTPRDMIERMVEPFSDTMPPADMFLQSEDEQNAGVPDWVRTPRRQARRWLQNVARTRTTGFDGHAAINALMRVQQGYFQEAQDILDQSAPDMSTGVGTGGAPTSQIYLFPMIMRLFPQLIAQEIAAIQPMDRPEGKIFFKDTYRKEVGQNETAPDGTIIGDRARIDLGSANPPDPHYADDPGEFETANILQMRLSSIPVTAVAKKLAAIWSIEETQDLRAYHGLDAAAELLSDMATEIAMEWNYIVLSEMLAGATAGNLNYSVDTPAGFTYKEWQRELSRTIMSASTEIFKRRNGEMTHVVAGPDAWLALSNSMTMATSGSGDNPSLYAGLVFTPFADGALANIKTYKTNLWKGVNRNKILIIRKGTSWSDTPYVWAPYTTYTSPVLTLSDAFTQKQGIMDRVAHRTVVGDAMATVSITSGTGTPIPFPVSS